MLKKHSVTKNCSSDREKGFKFEAEGREFAGKVRKCRIEIGKNNWDLKTCRKS